MSETLDVAVWVATIGEPAEAWKLRCFEIALAGASATLVPGKAVYGKFLAQAHPESPLYRPGQDKVGYRHGWVIDRDTGIIYDPTRWVFENAPPYIFKGAASAHPEYDEGSNTFNRMFRQPCPPMSGPMYKGHRASWGQAFRPDLPPSLIRHLQTLIGDDRGFNRARVHWLANHAPEELGDACKVFYEYLAKTGMRTAVPYDNWMRVMEGG